MRKEKLLAVKTGVVNGLPWYVKAKITDEEIRRFSLSQLRTLSEILGRAENYRENCSPFYTLSVHEVLRKETGEIAYFDQKGVREETEEEVLSGAARGIYRSYMRNKPSGQL